MDPLEAGMRNAQATGLFETTVLTAFMPEAEKVNAELERIVMERMAQDPGVDLSNINGWQSAQDMLSAGWGGPAAASVARFALGACNRYSTDLGMQDQPRFEWTADMWANVGRRGAANNLHVHPQAFWSAVYYVNDGYDGVDDEALGGEIVFLDPRYPTNRMYSMDMVFKSPQGRPQHYLSRVRPKAGMLLAFPSWLFHYVNQYHGDGTRISLAINMCVIPVRGGPAK